ncbi:hypothetical protein [Labrenzia sp. PHM005]|uniref:hypothetical protein n=1 Tax=Labrenzia sp. PHM005 TaxID=2590016 RepID=UPI0011405BC3|nr:hypothetical protein [Labrenzia sp. PHM005]QDG74812.1 hypothetical protein FJ695_02420 [Labrenzia sp. PHM005]
MLQRPAVIDDLQVILSDWVTSLDSPKLLGAFLFGSTVNEDGVRFQPDMGDLDVIVVVDWESVSPGERIAQINQLRDAKLDLETNLFRKLSRENGSKQIVSLVPITPFEVDQAVHKDGVNHILTGARAYDLFKKCEIDSLNGGQSSSPLENHHRTVLNFVQKKRAEALSVTPNGRGGMAPAAHDDPVPKELIRNFAVATADLEKHSDISELRRGLKEIGIFASEAADWTPLASQFASWFEVRQGARGEVDPVISHDHYLLLVEAIYDRVRQQYVGSNSAQFTGTMIGSVTIPATEPALPSSHRLKSTFRVTLSDKLGGSKSDVLRSIRAARANMKARVTNPFEILFEEQADADELLAIDDAMLDSKKHRRKVEAFERRTLIAARQELWTQGVELILYYGGSLFHGDEEVIEEACRTAIRNWFSIAATNVVNPGGMFEAFHTHLYPSHGMALSFSAEASPANLFEPKPLCSLEPHNLAKGFVPNLVSKYLYFVSQPARAKLCEKRDIIFNVSFWDYGLK